MQLFVFKLQILVTSTTVEYSMSPHKVSYGLL